MHFIYINNAKYNFILIFFINIVVFSTKRQHFINYLVRKSDFFNFY